MSPANGGRRQEGGKPASYIVSVAMAVAPVSFTWEIQIFPHYNTQNNDPEKDNGKNMSFGVKRSTADILMPSTAEMCEPGFLTEAVFANHREQ